jgi:hypothetical protein
MVLLGKFECLHASRMISLMLIEDSNSMMFVISEDGDAATEEVQVCCIQQNYPSGVTNLLERFQREPRKHCQSLPKCYPTLHHFSKKKT